VRFCKLPKSVKIDIEEIRKKIRALRDAEWIDTNIASQTGVAKQVEHLLGFGSQFGIVGMEEFEVKTSDISKIMNVTLLSRTPQLVEDLAIAEFVRKHGHFDSKMGNYSLFSTFSAQKENSRGWKINIDRKEGILEFHHHGEIVAIDSIDQIVEGIKNKLGNLMLVNLDSRIKDGVQQLNILGTYLLKNVHDVDIPNMLESHELLFEWRMILKKGARSVRDHGSRYSTYQRNLNLFYSERIDLQ